MSLWDSLAGIAKGIGQEMADQARARVEYIKKFQDQYADASDDKLIHMYKNSSGNKHLACGRMLKDRGYDGSDLE